MIGAQMVIMHKGIFNSQVFRLQYYSLVLAAHTHCVCKITKT